MKIVVLGATGNVGSRLTRLAAAAGHDVVAYVRRPEAVHAQKGVTVVGGQLEDSDALAAASKDADVVVVAITGKLTEGSFMRDHFPPVITALTQAQVKRVVLVSVFGAGDTAKKASLGAKVMYKTALARFLKDRAFADQLLQDSGLAWTIVYPVNLKDAPRSPQKAAVKRIDQVEKVPGFPVLPLDDAAAALLDIVTDTSLTGARLLITTPDGWK